MNADQKILAKFAEHFDEIDRDIMATGRASVTECHPAYEYYHRVVLPYLRQGERKQSMETEA